MLDTDVGQIYKPLALVDARGRQGRAPPGGPNSFIFMQFSECALPQENPGSATVYPMDHDKCESAFKFIHG